MRYVKLLICTLLAFALILCGGCRTNTEHSVPKTEKVSVWEEKNSSVESLPRFFLHIKGNMGKYNI